VAREDLSSSGGWWVLWWRWAFGVRLIGARRGHPQPPHRRRVKGIFESARWKRRIGLTPEDLKAWPRFAGIVQSDADTIRQLMDSDAELARGEGETEEHLAEAMKRRREAV
jgi:hypothetical protein